MEEKNIEVIKNSIKELLGKMGFVCEVEINDETKASMADDKEEEIKVNLVCNVKVEGDSNFLIGQYGVNLQALQHLTRLIVRRKMEEKINFILDVNSYRQQKNQSIVEQAESAAEQAIQEKRAVVMKPMSAYERRIVHLTLGGNNKIITESIGEGENRKVVIKPRDSIA